MLRDNVLAALSFASALCIITLIGLYRYSSSFLPSDKNGPSLNGIIEHPSWLALILVPIITAAWWGIQLAKKR